MLRSCYIGSCHVGVSKRFSCSISLAVTVSIKNFEASFSVFDLHSRKLVRFQSKKIVFCFKQETYLLSLRRGSWFSSFGVLGVLGVFDFKTPRKCPFKILTKRHIKLFLDGGELIVSWVNKQFQTAQLAKISS